MAKGGPYGYMRCEGSGTLILRRLSDAEASGERILAKILRTVAGSAGPREGAEEGPGRVYQAPSGMSCFPSFPLYTLIIHWLIY